MIYFFVKVKRVLCCRSVVTVRIFLSVSQAISLFTSALPVIGLLKADEEKREGVLDLTPRVRFRAGSDR